MKCIITNKIRKYNSESNNIFINKFIFYNYLYSYIKILFWIIIKLY